MVVSVMAAHTGAVITPAPNGSFWHFKGFMTKFARDKIVQGWPLSCNNKWGQSVWKA